MPKVVGQPIAVIPTALSQLVEDGDVEAFYQVACFHSEQLDNPADAQVMLENWQRAADAGHPMAMLNLGICHRDGLAGLSPNADAADQWFQKAEGAGLPNVSLLASPPRASPASITPWVLQSVLFLVTVGLLAFAVYRYRQWALARETSAPAVIDSGARPSVGFFSGVGQFTQRYSFILFLGAWIGMILANEAYIWGWTPAGGAIAEQRLDWVAVALIRSLLFGIPLAAILVVFLERLGFKVLPALFYDGRPLPKKISKDAKFFHHTYGFPVRKAPHLVLLTFLFHFYGPVLIPDLPVYVSLLMALVLLSFLGSLDMDSLPQLNIDVPSNRMIRRTDLPNVFVVLPFVVFCWLLLSQLIGGWWAFGFLLVIWFYAHQFMEPIAQIFFLTFKPRPVCVMDGKTAYRRKAFPDYLKGDTAMFCWWSLGLAYLVTLGFIGADWPHPGRATDQVTILGLVVFAICCGAFSYLVSESMKDFSHKLPQVLGLSWILALACSVFFGLLPGWADFSTKTEAIVLMVFYILFFVVSKVYSYISHRGRSTSNLDLFPKETKNDGKPTPFARLLMRQSRVILLLGTLFAMFTVLPHEAAAVNSLNNPILVWVFYTLAIGVPVAALGALIQQHHGAITLPMQADFRARQNTSGLLNAVSLTPFNVWLMALLAASVILGWSSNLEGGDRISLFFLPMLLTLPVFVGLYYYMNFFLPLMFYPEARTSTREDKAAPVTGPWLQPTNAGLVIRWRPLLGTTSAILLTAWMSSAWLTDFWGATSSKSDRVSEMLSGGKLNDLKQHAAGFLLPVKAFPLSREPGSPFITSLSQHLGDEAIVKKKFVEDSSREEHHVVTAEGGKFLCVWQVRDSTGDRILKKIHPQPKLQEMKLTFRPNRKIHITGRSDGGERTSKILDY